MRRHRVLAKRIVFDNISSIFQGKKYKTRAQILKEDVTCMFMEASDSLSMLELIDSISKLGLDKYFEEQIKAALDAIALKKNNYSFEDDLYATALCFRLLRHYGYSASQGTWQNSCQLNQISNF